MKTEEAIEIIKGIYNADRGGILELRKMDIDEIISLLQQGEKDRAELGKIRAGDYPEIEKIFIDFDRYCHSIEIGEEARKMNPYQAKYIDGYKECYNDIRNRIRELIKEKKNIWKRTEKKDTGSIRNEKQAIEALKKLMYKTEDGIKERNIPEYQHKFNNWLRGLIKEFEEGKIKWMG